VRPAGMYGHEDWLLNAAAHWPALFKLNGGHTRILPVHVMDVASALEVILDAPLTSTASTFSLPGPLPYTHNELLRLLAFFTLKSHLNAPTIPKPVALAIASFFNRALWWPTISPDEIERKYIDDVGVDAFFKSSDEGMPSGWAEPVGPPQVTGIDGEPVKSWADLEMTPDHLEEHALLYLRRYRSAATYDTPLELGEFKQAKEYHVVP